MADIITSEELLRQEKVALSDAVELMNLQSAATVAIINKFGQGTKKATDKMFTRNVKTLNGDESKVNENATAERINSVGTDKETVVNYCEVYAQNVAVTDRANAIDASLVAEETEAAMTKILSDFNLSTVKRRGFKDYGYQTEGLMTLAKRKVRITPETLVDGLDKAFQFLRKHGCTGAVCIGVGPAQKRAFDKAIAADESFRAIGVDNVHGFTVEKYMSHQGITAIVYVDDALGNTDVLPDNALANGLELVVFDASKVWIEELQPLERKVFTRNGLVLQAPVSLDAAVNANPYAVVALYATPTDIDYTGYMCQGQISDWSEGNGYPSSNEDEPLDDGVQ